MPLDTMSLVGFMQEPHAFEYFRQACLMPNPGEPALRYHWQQARRKLGKGLIARPGRPNVMDIPDEYGEYLEGVKANPRFEITTQNRIWSYQLVEIVPLLAYQVHVLHARVNEVYTSLSHPPTLAECLSICLPLQVEPIPPTPIIPQPDGSFCIESDSLNLECQGIKMQFDQMDQKLVIGPALGVRSPLVQVAVWEGRYFLYNGYHRAIALHKAGATHVPCILFEAQTIEQAIAMGKGFEPRLLTSSNPPTVGHFARGMALNVSLRRLKRRIVLSFSVSQDEIFAE